MKEKTVEKWDDVYLLQENAYEWFSQSEDINNDVVKVLTKTNILKDKVVLEIGCGSGRYTQYLAKFAKKYYALDISHPLLELAKNKCFKIKNIKYLRSSAERIPLPDHSIDIIFSSWAMIMEPLSLRHRVFKEAQRVIKQGGEIIIIDNYWKGQFMDMRGTYEKRKAKANINWINKIGFTTTNILDSKFYFPDKHIAITNLKYIFGDKISKFLEKFNSNYLEHKILINRKKV